MNLPPLDFLNGLGVVAVVVIVGWMLIMGKGLATQRELRAANDEIRWLRDRNSELNSQASDLIRVLGPAAVDAMSGVRHAAEDISGRESRK